ncbi:methyltransferase domain-containing protein [Alcaligenes sp. MMA]|uniref:methyltransferase domain-containing protein n=1 Tax=Alcaligenes sp. MMA TaxID=2893019 RepID=UPI001E352DF0|nr:methyltransferase domain-containing protein [Alcaligenes sp. MMA]MCC9164562.1 methyltransferase domain-containing protein [Alcaligenes sp. MMA]
MKNNINSKDYWETRFLENWDENSGPEQSRFFARTALTNLPSWFVKAVNAEGLSIADWGCAQGDGTNVLVDYFPPSNLSGIDFSEESIRVANERYPAISFLAQDWLQDDVDGNKYDFVFSSNTLEHFHDPFSVVQKISLKARLGLIFALPYREYQRIDEHFFTFTENNIPIYLSDFKLAWSKVVDCSIIPNNMWPGDQIILLYVKESWLENKNLNLGDMHIDADSFNSPLLGYDSSSWKREYEFSRILRESMEELSGLIVNSNVYKDELRIKEEANKELLEKIKSLSASLAMRENDLAVKDGFLAAKEVEVNLLRSSSSWRLTRPLRALSRFFKNPVHFWQDTKNYVAWRRAGAVAAFAGHASEGLMQQGDWSWAQFEANVLAFRHEYKGVFVQSIVIDWNVPLYQRPQHMAKALGRLGYLVIYETNCWTCDDVAGARYLGDNVWLVNAVESHSLKGVLRSFYSTAHNEYGPHMLEGNAMVYEYIDHIDPAISGDNVQALSRFKDMAFGGDADYIVASSKALREEAIEEVGAEKVVFIPNGVDCAHYRRDWSHVTLPERYEQFLGKYQRIVGYFGALAPWLWYEVLNELAERLPDHGFVYLGPDYYGGIEKLSKRDNVLWLGAIDYAVLPAYAQRFDIAIIPFEPGEIARTTSPLKLFEYFALEVPVVVTSAMDECTCYPEVFSAASLEEYLEQIERAFLVKDDVQYRARMRELADENDWSARAEKMAPLFPSIGKQ